MEERRHAAAVDNSPEFFKIFTSSFCSEAMRVPPAFVSKFRRDAPGKFTLVGVDREKKWEITTRKQHESLFFVEGWPTFVKDNSLQDGDFLNFCYDRSSVFVVKIFGPHACWKDIDLAAAGASFRRLPTRTPGPDQPINDGDGDGGSDAGSISKRLQPRDVTGKFISTMVGHGKGGAQSRGRSLRPRDEKGKFNNCRGDDSSSTTRRGRCVSITFSLMHTTS